MNIPYQFVMSGWWLLDREPVPKSARKHQPPDLEMATIVYALTLTYHSSCLLFETVDQSLSRKRDFKNYLYPQDKDIGYFRLSFRKQKHEWSSTIPGKTTETYDPRNARKCQNWLCIKKTEPEHLDEIPPEQTSPPPEERRISNQTQRIITSQPRGKE